ncbi:hypothetical protein J4Q44_G00040270 [Coregonus suidteri]|uniref:Uncharacterized protein n=1 Tax=Coregonus suidteri TaxID=861788 RepID=A0AAN8MIL2_9TELE
MDSTVLGGTADLLLQMRFEKDARNHIFTPFLKNGQAPPWLALCSSGLPVLLLLSQAGRLISYPAAS